MSGRALIIDKDATFAARLEAVLRDHGYDVETRSTGREGIDEAKATEPNLIILCVELDDTSGYSICAKIKKDSRLKSIPLVITSEKATQETFDHHKKLKTRAQVYLMKPFEPAQLISELSEHIDLGPSSSVMLEANGFPLTPPPLPIGTGDIQARELDPSEFDEDDPFIPQTIGDEEAFGDMGMGMAIDGALASLSSTVGLIGDDGGIDGGAGLRDDYDEDDIRTTIGTIPAGVLEAAAPEPILGTQVRQHDTSELLLRLHDAERQRDEAIANERAAQAQLEALSANSSQIPAASSNREALALKKELNAKERELLELRDAVQVRDRQLLEAKEREAELEERGVQLEEERTQADRARIDAEGRIAGAEAKAEQIELTSNALIDELRAKLDEGNRMLESLERELQGTHEANEALRSELTSVRDTLSQKETSLEEREVQLADLRSELDQSRAEIATQRVDLEDATQRIEGLDAQAESLDQDLRESRSDAESLRHALADSEDRLARAIRRIREDADIRGKARQAIEIGLNLLNESDYGIEADLDVAIEGAEEIRIAEDASGGQEFN